MHLISLTYNGEMYRNPVPFSTTYISEVGLASILSIKNEKRDSFLPAK